MHIEIKTQEETSEDSDYRINAAARMNGMSYSKFMHDLRRKHPPEQKVLADMAVNDMEAFAKLVETVKAK